MRLERPHPCKVFRWREILILHHTKSFYTTLPSYASNFVDAVWGRPVSNPSWACRSAQSKPHGWMSSVWKIFDRPTQSPDLKPIRHLWDEVERRSSNLHALQNKCAQIPKGTLPNLVLSLATRDVAVTAGKLTNSESVLKSIYLNVISVHTRFVSTQKLSEIYSLFTWGY